MVGDKIKRRTICHGMRNDLKFQFQRPLIKIILEHSFSHLISSSSIAASGLQWQN
jgi:hypothetical protein